MKNEFISKTISDDMSSPMRKRRRRHCNLGLAMTTFYLGKSKCLLDNGDNISLQKIIRFAGNFPSETMSLLYAKNEKLFPLLIFRRWLFFCDNISSPIITIQRRQMSSPKTLFPVVNLASYIAIDKFNVKFKITLENTF